MSLPSSRTWLPGLAGIVAAVAVAAGGVALRSEPAPVDPRTTAGQHGGHSGHSGHSGPSSTTTAPGAATTTTVPTTAPVTVAPPAADTTTSVPRPDELDGKRPGATTGGDTRVDPGPSPVVPAGGSLFYSNKDSSGSTWQYTYAEQDLAKLCDLARAAVTDAGFVPSGPCPVPGPGGGGGALYFLAGSKVGGISVSAGVVQVTVQG